MVDSRAHSRPASGLTLRGRRFLPILLVIATGLLAMVIAPFAGSLFAAAVFATVLQPLQGRVSAAFGGRSRLAAGALVLSLTLVVLVPMGWLVTTVVQEVAHGIDRAVAIVDEKGTNGLIHELPESVQPLGKRAVGLLPAGILPPLRPEPDEKDVQPDARQAPANGDGTAMLASAARLAQRTVVGLTNLLIETGVLLVALFFLLVQGPALAHWVVVTMPLPNKQLERFVDEFRDVTVAVFVSTVTTAVLQAAVAAVGYLIVGIPLLPVALLVTLMAAVIPAIGGATVVVTISGLLLLADRPGSAAFLAVWGLLPVALCDNLAKPLLAQRRLRLPGAVIFFAMLGGLSMFGPMGVVAGPLIVSFFLVVLRAIGSGSGGGEPERAAPRTA